MTRFTSANRFSGILPQVLAVFIATLSALSNGMTYGWTAPVLPILESPNSPIPITQTDVTWLENVYMLGGLAGLPVVIFCVDKFGRKKSILLAAVQDLIAWILIAFAPSIEYLYVARFLSGMAGDVGFVSIPMYIGEIANKQIRGFLGSWIYLMMLIGIIMVYSVAPFVPIPITSAVASSFLILLLLTFPFMPESPYYLLLKGAKGAAKKSLQWFRSTEDVQQELEEISAAVERQQAERGRFVDLVLVKSNRKALMIMTVLNCAQHFGAISIMIMSVHSILEDAASMLTPSTAAIIFAVLMLVAATFSASLMDKTGRKVLLITSSILTGLCLLTLASYFAVKNSGIDMTPFNWVPVVCVMLYAITFRLGMGMIPIVLTGELFPTSVKAMSMAFMDGMYIVSSVASVYLFQTLKSSTGMHVPFYIFGSICLLTSIFAYFVVPETKGKTLEEIQQILKGNSIKISSGSTCDIISKTNELENVVS